MASFALCSDCFRDQGLKFDAAQIGIAADSACPHCGSKAGRKLTVDLISALAYRFFVWGTIHRCDYGAAPVIQFNRHQPTSIDTLPWFEPDLRLIEQAIGVGFFYYGPRLWMVGEVDPLARISHTNRRIGAANQRKLLCRNDLTRIRGEPRWRQSVARNRLILEPWKVAV
jgi:hypothetical protein